MVPAPSVLGRIARHGVSGDRNPREDRLTEVLAAVLASPHCDGLAKRVAQDWLSIAAQQHPGTTPPWIESAAKALATSLSWNCDVRTQVRFANGGELRRPDLELHFVGEHADGRSEEVWLWIEVKHGTGPHSQQLAAYQDEQRRRGLPKAGVLLVAPRAQIPGFAAEEIPPQVPVLTWQDTARCIDATRRGGTPVGDFLMDELVTYLREEELVDPERLSPEHLVALTYGPEAESALSLICRLGSERLTDAQGRPPDSVQIWRREAAYGRGYWEAWSILPTGDQLERWLDWNVTETSGHERAHGRGLLFVSGLCVTPGLPFALTTEDEERHGILARGVSIDGRVVRFERFGDDQERLAQVAYPEEVLVGTTLDAQARSLADWVLRGFRAFELPIEQLRMLRSET